LSRSIKRPVARSRISASSSQLSQIRAQHLDVVRGLVEGVPQPLPQPGGVEVGVVLAAQRLDLAPAEVGRPFGGAVQLHPDAGPAGAGVVDRGDRLREVERLSVIDDRSRQQPYAAGHGRDPGRDKGGVEAPANPVSPVVGLERMVGLKPESVLDRDEVDEAAFGPLNQVDPVLRGEQFAGTGIGLTPRGGMPAGAVQRDREVQRVGRT
jgi:hypothetical protein